MREKEKTRLQGGRDSSVVVSTLKLLGSVVGSCSLVRWLDLRSEPHANVAPAHARSLVGAGE